jgi:2-keto-3-deoxy-L-fuconate dehydrogenase
MWAIFCAPNSRTVAAARCKREVGISGDARGFSLLLASHGSIVNIGSVAGMIGVKHRLAYCTSKGAVIAMTRQIAVDYPKEIRVNCICPGTVDTPFVESYLNKYHPHEKEKVRAEVTARQPIRAARQSRRDRFDGAVPLFGGSRLHQRSCALPIDGGWTAA